MKLEGKINNISYDIANDNTRIEFVIPRDITSSLEKYIGLEVNLELKKGKRSNNANAYLWVLIGELQQKLKIPKEEIYTKYVRECGVYDVYCTKNEAVEAFKEWWHDRGLGWVCDTQPSKFEGFTNIFAYRGTSDYDKEQMSVILSNVVEDCIEQDIPTQKQEDIDRLIEEWK